MSLWCGAAPDGLLLPLLTHPLRRFPLDPASTIGPWVSAYRSRQRHRGINYHGVTIFCYRCRHEPFTRMPLCLSGLAWVPMFLVVTFLFFFSPPLSRCSIMLVLERFLARSFFRTQAGGSAIWCSNFFWISFGHPEVLYPVLPGVWRTLGIVPGLFPEQNRSSVSNDGLRAA